MVKRIFTKDFTRQEPICEEGIVKALDILKTGKLHRYNIDRGEKSEADSFGRRVRSIYG